MSTWTNTTKNTPTWTNRAKSDVIATGGPVGQAMGVLGLTYSGVSNSVSTIWSNLTKNITTWSQPTKN